jgi:hypothetical protein
MKYYIIVASKDHVNVGENGGFAKAGHGKKSQLIKLKKNDWVIYYSSKETLEERKPYQKFTAISQVTDDEPYQVIINENFKPWRRNVDFYDKLEIEIRPLLSDFKFIVNEKNVAFT